MRTVTALARRRVECVSDLTIDRWLLGETPGSDEARRLEEHMKECTGCASRIGALRGLYSTQPVPALQQPPVTIAKPPEATPSQTGALQFLILRDGLLVGSEFFTPGTYVIGSDPRADLQLDGVLPLHARLYFRDGKVAVKAEGGPVWVSGFKIESCEVRSIDEVLVGPYVLRARVIRERWSDVHREPVTELTVVDPPVALPHPDPLPKGEGASRVTAELWWGDTRQAAASFVHTVTAKDLALDDLAPDFILAAPRPEGGFLVRIPGSEQTLNLGESHAFDLGALKLTWRVDEVLPQLPRAKTEGWPVLLLAAVMMTMLFGGMALVPEPEEQPFEDKTLHPFVKLIPPPKPEPKQKAPDRTNTPPKDPQQTQRAERPRPAGRPPQPTTSRSDPLKFVKKLTGGAAFKNLLASASTATKSTGTKQPNMFAGLGTPGAKGAVDLGILTDGPIGSKGAKSGGQMGQGRIGKGKVGGVVVDRPSGSSLALRGPIASIDKDALARVINEHLHEVSACYERALIRSGDGGGKLSVEWTVTTSGDVASAKVKSSSLKDGSIASCVLTALKRWHFPPARGGNVVVSYPFIFRSSDF